MDDDEIQAEIDAIAQEYDRDPDAVRELYETKLEAIQSVDVIGVDDDGFASEALSTVRANLQNQSRTGGFVAGDVSEVPILAVGNYGVFENWGKKNDTVMVGVGIAAPEDTDNDNRPPGVAVFILKESVGLDIGKAREMWTWGNHIRGWFVVDKMTESFQTRDRTYYICDSTDQSKMEEADFSDSLPETPEDVKNFLGENFIKETFTFENIGDALSVGGEDFGSQWADLRRFTGYVVDSFRRTPDECDADQNPFGKYTLIPADEDVSLEEMERDRNLMTEDDVENGRQPGLQVFIPPEAVKYGDDSKLEVYGTLERNSETGQVTMRGVGAAPLTPFPRDDPSGGDSDNTEEETL